MSASALHWNGQAYSGPREWRLSRHQRAHLRPQELGGIPGTPQNPIKRFGFCQISILSDLVVQFYILDKSYQKCRFKQH